MTKVRIHVKPDNTIMISSANPYSRGLDESEEDHFQRCMSKLEEHPIFQDLGYIDIDDSEIPNTLYICKLCGLVHNNRDRLIYDNGKIIIDESRSSLIQDREHVAYCLQIEKLFNPIDITQIIHLQLLLDQFNEGQHKPHALEPVIMNTLGKIDKVVFEENRKNSITFLEEENIRIEKIKKTQTDAINQHRNNLQMQVDNDRLLRKTLRVKARKAK